MSTATGISSRNEDATSPTQPAHVLGADANEKREPLTIISPHRGWFDWRLKQLWRYRDLILLFVWRDFVSIYKQTILGPLWHLIRPLATTVIFTLVFSRIARLPTDGAPPFLFYLAGQIAWTYFASCFEAISKTFVTNAHLLGKVYFHRLAIPVSLILSNLVAFGLQLGVFAVMLVIFHHGDAPRVTWWLAALPVAVFVLCGFALGGGIIICALTTRYRDLSHLVTLCVQLMMYVTPVIYSVSSVPPAFQRYLQLNPLTPVFEVFRLALLGVGTVTIEQLGVSFGAMVIVMVVGLMLFSRIERTFMDTL